MAKCGITNIGGGGGIGSDELTVTKDYVLSGLEYVGADTDDEKGVGIMPDMRVLDPEIGGINSNYPNLSIHKPDNLATIQLSDTTVSKEKLLAIAPPTGYYKQNYVGTPLDTVASVTGVTPAKILAGQMACGVAGTATSDANASAPNILINKSAYVNGAKILGSMPDYSKTPTQINNIRINNNRFEVAVAAGYHGGYWAGGGYEFMTYDQVANAIGLTSAKLKKGETVCGITGTFEGYVPGAQDLYYRGNNVIGWTTGAGWSFQAGQISVSSANNNGSGTFSTVGKSYLNIEGSTNGVAGTSAQSWTLERYNGGWINVGSVSWNEHGYYTKSINVANAQVAGNFRLTGYFTQDTIFRIWLS